MFTKQFLFGIALFLILGLSLVGLGGVASAQTTTDSLGTTTTGTDTGTMDTTGVDNTAPGAPNTGAGGNATTNILLLVTSAALAAIGVGYVYRTSLNVR
jgi:hypothetical protein